MLQYQCLGKIQVITYIIIEPRGYLQGKDKTGAAIGILSAPGAGGMPWERQVGQRHVLFRCLDVALVLAKRSLLGAGLRLCEFGERGGGGL